MARRDKSRGEDAIQRAKNKRKRVKDKKQIEKTTHLLYLLKERCLDQLDPALDLLQIDIEEFSDSGWDCRNCPMFLACSMSNRFTNHPKGWKFQWLTDGP